MDNRNNYKKNTNRTYDQFEDRHARNKSKERDKFKQQDKFKERDRRKNDKFKKFGDED